MKEECFPAEISVVAGSELQNVDEESAKGGVHAAMCYRETARFRGKL